MTQAEVTELMVILRELQGLGWSIATDSSTFEVARAVLAVAQGGGC